MNIQGVSAKELEEKINQLEEENRRLKQEIEWLEFVGTANATSDVKNGSPELVVCTGDTPIEMAMKIIDFIKNKNIELHGPDADRVSEQELHALSTHIATDLGEI